MGHCYKSFACAAYPKKWLRIVSPDRIKRGPDFNRAERLINWEGLNPCGVVSDTLSLILLIVLSTQYQGINFNTLCSQYFSGHQKFNSKL
jgi:hypothetical protein